jgi:hypothetical protein
MLTSCTAAKGFLICRFGVFSGAGGLGMSSVFRTFSFFSTPVWTSEMQLFVHQ